MRKIKVNDVVIVHTGSNSGKSGKVISLNKKTSSLKVEGVNEVKKAVKPTQENPQGGFTTKLLSIHVSNVALISPKGNKASKVKIVKDAKGKNTRALKKCGTSLK
jgi:large subunit ribosomal protein L24